MRITTKRQQQQQQQQARVTKMVYKTNLLKNL